VAKSGVLDLRDWDFEKNAIANLDGEWGFFWSELIEPNQSKLQNPNHYVKIPDVWMNYDIDGTKISSEGYATYYLQVYPSEMVQVYGLHNEGQGSAYTLWVDGKLLSQKGRVGTTFESMIPEKTPDTIFFEPDGELVEIVIQVSNFHHRKGGFRNSILLGPAETIHRYQLQNWFIEAFSAGTLFPLGLYYFFIYLFRGWFRNK